MMPSSLFCTNYGIKWAGDFSNISSSMKDLAIGFQLVVALNESTFEDVRNKV